jgi:hypothetical protein
MRGSIAVLATLLVTGCAAPVLVTGVGVTSVVSTETTGKGLADHAISQVQDKDCKLARVFENEPTCRARPIAPVVADTHMASSEQPVDQTDSIAEANRAFAKRARSVSN